MKDLPLSSKNAFERHVKHFPSGSDLELQVLKGHLLIENILRELVDTGLRSPEAIRGARLTFHQVACLARGLTQHAEIEPWNWTVVGKLNSVRNELAHQLEQSQLIAKVAELISFAKSANPSIEDDRKALGLPDGNDFELVVMSLSTYLTALLSFARKEVPVD
jgi:hypothetical protein